MRLLQAEPGVSGPAIVREPASGQLNQNNKMKLNVNSLWTLCDVATIRTPRQSNLI